MSDFLSAMASESRARLVRATQAVPLPEMRRRALARPRRRRLSLHATGFDIIAEVKRTAPSVGVLNSDTGALASQMVAQRSDAYTRGGATAVSVLTESSSFNGELTDITVAAASTPIPVMRKDFLIDPYQVFEAKAHDAMGVLLIARLLQHDALEQFVAAAEETGQFILLELFGMEEIDVLEAVMKLVANRDVQLLVGVNSRDLGTLRVDPDRLANMAPHLPTQFPLVAESGLKTVMDIRHVATLGYRVALIGTALMQSANPANDVSQLIDAGRATVKACASK